jgi:hypothetical protein
MKHKSVLFMTGILRYVGTLPSSMLTEARQELVGLNGNLYSCCTLEVGVSHFVFA